MAGKVSKRRRPKAGKPQGPMTAQQIAKVSTPPVARRRSRSAIPKEIQFDYLKSALFRVVYADGFHGGLTPNGRKVHLAVFNERRPIAQSEVYALTPAGGLAGMKSRTERKGFVREVEVSVLMDIEKAAALYKWLELVFEKLKAEGRTAPVP